jgi:flagellar hook assembly protein FlgD
LRGRARGAQRASSHETQANSSRVVLATVVAALAFLIALGGHVLLPAQGVRAGSTAGAGQKAVFIVGPSSGSTYEYLDQARGMANQAEAEGMKVIRVFTPHATFQRVLEVIQNANLVVYFGHGNGWPSPYPPYQEATKDGLGLNPSSGGGTTSPVDYKGADKIREKVTLAKNAVVVLYRLCYASGNAEQGMRPEYPDSASDRNVATERVDNFAAGFLAVGAGTVFAWGWPQKINLPQRLAETNDTMDTIFMDPANKTGSPNAFIGTNDYYRTSSRTAGAQIHLDPHPVYGHLRALSGNLEMTAGEFRGETPAPDTVAPRLTSVSTSVGGTVRAAGASPATFSPNGDGITDDLEVNHRVSEPCYIDITITDAGGATVRRFHRWYWQGSGFTNWNGRNGQKAIVPDGLYRLSLTPKDPAGNVGKTVSISARVLTTLMAPSRSTPAINVADGDALAASVRFGVTLTHDAKVSWKIVNASGTTVRTHLTSQAEQAGTMHWTWYGKDAAGISVPNGWYRSVITATTANGTMRYVRDVAVGPYRVNFSDTTPKRGQHITVTVYNTEPLTAAPRLTITQPGVDPYSISLARVNSGHSRANVALKWAGTEGIMQILITGTDTGGQVESQTVTLHLH